MDYKNIVRSLRKKNYEVSVFKTKEAATDYLSGIIKNFTVGFGDSQTLAGMNLNEILSAENIVFDPLKTSGNEEFLAEAKRCLTADIYITSANAITLNGDILNMDGTGNRISASLFGHKKVYYVIGRNKICSCIETAVERIRNTAAPLNAKRLGLNTPCAVRGDRCYDCSSSDRICNALVIESRKMRNIDMEVILIDEDLGY